MMEDMTKEMYEALDMIRKGYKVYKDSKGRVVVTSRPHVSIGEEFGPKECFGYVVEVMNDFPEETFFKVYDERIKEMKEHLMKRLFCTQVFLIDDYQVFKKCGGATRPSLEQATQCLLEQLNVHVRVEVDDDDEEQAFNVPAWLDDVPTVDIIAQIVDPQGQGRAVQNLVNAAGKVLNSIHPLSFFQSLAKECYYSSSCIPETDFCMRLIANWGEPKIN